MAEQFTPSMDQLAAAIVNVFRLERIRATVQRIDPVRPGYAYVTFNDVNGVELNRSVRVRAVVSMAGGTPVLLGYDHERQLAIVEPDFDTQIAVNINPHVNNPANLYFYGATNQQTLQTLFVQALGSTTADSLEVVIRPFFYMYLGAWFYLVEQRLDLSGSLPSSGNHCLALIYLKTDNTVGVALSTEQDILDPLDETDCTECQTATSDYLTGGRFIKLHGDQTNIMDADMWRDARVLINLEQPSGGGGSGVDLTARQRSWFGI